MQISIAIALFCFLIGRVFAETTNGTPTNRITFPDTVSGRQIASKLCLEANGLTNADLQLAYLSSVVSNTLSTNLERNFYKASAIRLLGFVGNTNSIDILISQIAFRDNSSGTYPTVESMVLFGEKAVPQLLCVVRDSATKPDIGSAVEALKRIKGSQYEKFVLEQKTTLPDEKWKRLVRYAYD